MTNGVIVLQNKAADLSPLLSTSLITCLLMTNSRNSLIMSFVRFPSYFRRGGFLRCIDMREEKQEDGVVT
jgi:hypothetical protein